MDSGITYLKKSATKERMDYKIAYSKKAAMKGTSAWEALSTSGCLKRTTTVGKLDSSLDLQSTHPLAIAHSP